jgi:hypothetical protein
MKLPCMQRLLIYLPILLLLQSTMRQASSKLGKAARTG